MTISRNLFFIFMTVIIGIFPVISHADDEQSITVQVTGQGANKPEALEDALRNAVRKVVGTYIITQTTLKEEDLDEAVYVNADAVVTKHEEVSSKKEDGLVILEIKATVVKNNLLKYFKKTESTHISDTDLGNLRNKRRAIANAEKSLDYIFNDYCLRIYKAKWKGWDVDPDDDFESVYEKFLVTYEVSFSQQDYHIFHKRLSTLLSKVCIAQETHSADNLNFWTRRGLENDFLNREGGDPKQGRRIIGFVEKRPNGKIDYHFYIVPKQIREKIASLISPDGVLVFSFDIRGKERPAIRALSQRMSFWSYDDENIVFWPWMDYGDKTISEKESFMVTWIFSSDESNGIKACAIKASSGVVGTYLYAKANHHWSKMQDAARQGYIPAMISMVEDFGNTNSGWYEYAALQGSRYAQEKLGWKNAGLGFTIDRYNNGFRIEKVQKGIPVKRNMVIKSIAGTDVTHFGETQLANFIGNLPAGIPVTIEFEEGKNIEIKPHVP